MNLEIARIDSELNRFVRQFHLFDDKENVIIKMLECLSQLKVLVDQNFYNIKESNDYDEYLNIVFHWNSFLTFHGYQPLVSRFPNPKILQNELDYKDLVTNAPTPPENNVEEQKRFKIIIVDDHPLLREGIKIYLAAYKEFKFIGEFKDIRSLLNADSLKEPDAIILDINLSGVDGKRSLSVLKRRYPACKVVAFTHQEISDKELNKIGLDGYITKGDFGQLLAALNTVLRREDYFGNTIATDKASAEPEKLTVYLTPREREVVKFIVRGLSRQEIAEQMHVAVRTVDTYRNLIHRKLGVKSMQEVNDILKKVVLK